MKRSRTIGLCLTALFALFAFVASTASAADPALYQCGKVVKNAKKEFTGHYTSSKCTEASKVATGGKFEIEEWRLGSKTTGGKGGKVKLFKSVGKHGGKFEVPHVSTVECSNTTDTGEFSGPKTGKNINVTFTGCKTSSEPCQNTSKLGEIHTRTLKGEVGYINAEKHSVGFDLSAETANEKGEFANAEFECGFPGTAILHIRVLGSIVGEVKPISVNTWTNTAVVNFEQISGKNTLEKLEGFPKDVLLTAYCKAKEPCEPEGEIQSGESTLSEGKGETLFLKA